MYCNLAVLMAQKDPHLSQSKLAKEVGISANAINRLFGNKFDRVDVGTVEKLCDYFDCPIGGPGGLFIRKDED